MQPCDHVAEAYKHIHKFGHIYFLIFLLILAGFVFAFLFSEIFNEKLDKREKGERPDDEDYIRAFLGRRKKTDYVPVINVQQVEDK
ncbi:hypothetical protein F5B20DRAFT_575012 [Whalleya microplaca]|nr:hypothetical protein F5B20DRAFT_575012 [Whalleya microplaca]